MAGLFTNILKRKNGDASQTEDLPIQQKERKDISEELFVEKSSVTDDSFTGGTRGILAIYHYLEGDFERKGFDDAMIYDTPYLLDNYCTKLRYNYDTFLIA